ncbi:hypothetical protein LPJ63_002720 [Coemansia sp. RSA 2711]|nr:hypothetical protein LPJ63_002720 [Coemansia sp. RSA 2711]
MHPERGGHAGQSWSEIEDASGAEDDSSVTKKKRILRYGRQRLSEMRERFNAAKARLYEQKQQQLDLEWAQLQDGTHPQYREYAGLVDARWADRLTKIDLKHESSRSMARRNLEASTTSATTSFVAARRELRQRLIHRRKQRLWGLTDELRGLERISETIENIANPLSNQGAADLPVKGTAAPRDSGHLLNLPDSRLPAADEDADVSAIRGIPALLNQPDAELAVPDDVASGSHVPITDSARAGAAEAADTRVPGYAHPGYSSAAYAYQSDAVAASEYAHSYGHYGTAAAATAAAPPPAAASAQPSDRAYYTDASGYRYPQQQGYYDSNELQTNGVAVVHPANGHGHHQHGGDHHRHSASHSRVSELVHTGADVNGATAYPPSANYYDGQATPASAHQHAATSGKRDGVSEYDDTPSKRQRLMQQSGTWPTSSTQSQAGSAAEYAGQDGRAWAANGRATDPSTAMPAYGYGRQQYHYSHAYPQQGEYPYYGSSKYDYGNAYYQQSAAGGAGGYSGSVNGQPQSAHYQQGPDGTYYQTPSHYSQAQHVQQSATAGYSSGYPAEYRTNGSSYAGLETGIAMAQPVTADQYSGRYAQQQQQQQSGAWNEYYQQQQQYAQTPSAKAQHYYSRQAGREYYEHGYYAGAAQQPRVATEVAGGEGHYPSSSLSNILK